MLGDKMKQYRSLLDRKEELREQLKAVNIRLQELDKEIIQELETAGVDNVSSDDLTITRKVELRPKIIDKQKFVHWCVENDMVDELLQKRCNTAPFRAYVAEYGEYPPGTDGYTWTKLNVRRK